MLHNALRRAGGLLDGIRRMVGGDLEVNVERVGETVTPILNPWGLPEWAFLRGERLCARMRSIVAVAAELGFGSLSNPAGSGKIIVVDAVKVRADGVDASFTLSQPIADATIVAGQDSSALGAVRDSRWPLSTVAVNRIGATAAGLGLVSAEAFRVTALVEKFAGFCPFVLTPGFGIVVECATVNVAFSVGFAWRERSALPGELA